MRKVILAGFVFFLVFVCFFVPVLASDQEEPPGDKYIFSDELQLQRDYRHLSPIVRVKPEIVSADKSPWRDLGNGLRRKVFFSDRLTAVLLEFNQLVNLEARIRTHYHVHDQISYIIEGRARVQVGSEVRELGPGGVYIVPSNVHHGVVPLTEKLLVLDTFTPPREDYRPEGPYANRFSDNEIVSFVYRWFSLLEKHTPVDLVLDNLTPGRINFKFPEDVLKSHDDFRKWYGSFQRNFKSSRYTLSDIRVKSRKNGQYQVNLDVLWEAEAYDGELVRAKMHQEWLLLDTGRETPVIRNYTVSNRK